MGTDGGDMPASEVSAVTAAVDLYWLPLGAGRHFVRLNGRVYEAFAARLQRRPACDLYHSALISLPTIGVSLTPGSLLPSMQSRAKNAPTRHRRRGPAATGRPRSPDP